MATEADLITRIKAFLDISDATYDDELDDFLDASINILAGRGVLTEVARDASVTISADETEFSLPSGVEEIRRLELYDADIADYVRCPDFIQHGTKIYLDNAVPVATATRIYGLAKHTIATLPAELEMPVVYWVVSMFYSLLAGNRRKYNAYLGTSGSAANRDMKESAQYYKELGDDLLLDAKTVRGE